MANNQNLIPTNKRSKADCMAVSKIDNEIKGRGLFGGGFLLSTHAAAERAAAERAAAERILLSVRERRLVKSLNTVNP